MFQEDKNEVKQMINKALAEFKVPEVKIPPAYDDSALKAEISALKDEIKKLKEPKIVNKFK